MKAHPAAASVALEQHFEVLRHARWEHAGHVVEQEGEPADMAHACRRACCARARIDHCLLCLTCCVLRAHPPCLHYLALSGDSYVLAFHDAVDAVGFCLQVRGSLMCCCRSLLTRRAKDDAATILHALMTSVHD